MEPFILQLLFLVFVSVAQMDTLSHDKWQIKILDEKKSCCFDEPSPANFIKIGNKYLMFREEKVKWFDAFTTCRKENSDLASIDSLEELNAVTDSWIEQQGNFSDLWLGSTDQFEENEFFWMSNGNKIAKELWHHMEPNNLNSSEHCVHIKEWDDIIKLNDLTCTEHMSYICEKQVPSMLMLTVWE